MTSQEIKAITKQVQQEIGSDFSSPSDLSDIGVYQIRDSWWRITVGESIVVHPPYPVAREVQITDDDTPETAKEKIKVAFTTKPDSSNKGGWPF